MKKVVLTIVVLAITLTALAQATQPCIVKQYNQKQQKTPLAGVQVEVRGAQTATSAANGALSLQFATLKPGDRVPFRAATKAGYELMNKTAVEQWNISRDQKPFEIVLIQSAYFTQLKGKLKQSSVDSYHEKYEKARAELEKLQKEGKLKEQEYYDKLNELEDRYDSQLKNLDAYVDQFARIDLSELSEQEQQFIELAHSGRLDEAAEAYNSLNAAGKYITAVENVRKLNEDIAKLEDEKAQQQEAAKTFYAMLQRQVNTLKLAGGEENYKKAGELLKRAALADTTDIDAVWEYAYFAQNQHDFKDAERFYLIALNGSKDNLYLQSVFLNNLGNLYDDLHDYAKAEEYMLKALENRTQLFHQNPDAYRYELASTQNNLGVLYYDLHDYAKAEDYYLKALENYTQLFTQYPDAYRADLAMTQNNLGILYKNLHDYAKSEEYYLKALENKTQLFTQNPDAYRADLAMTQWNLMLVYAKTENWEKYDEMLDQALKNYKELALNNSRYQEKVEALNHRKKRRAEKQYDSAVSYYNNHDYAKSEEYYLKALENYILLFTQNPDAYRADLTDTQDKLGLLYCYIPDFKKAEEYYLKALENYTQLISQNPERYRYYMAIAQHNMGYIYLKTQNYSKSEEYLRMALENKTVLYNQNPDDYRKSLANTTNDLGEILLMKGDEQEALKLWQKVLELDPDFLQTHDSDLYKQLKEKGLITE